MWRPHGCSTSDFHRNNSFKIANLETYHNLVAFSLACSDELARNPADFIHFFGAQRSNAALASALRGNNALMPPKIRPHFRMRFISARAHCTCKIWRSGTHSGGEQSWDPFHYPSPWLRSPLVAIVRNRSSVINREEGFQTALRKETNTYFYVSLLANG